jgi:hypothetical protein
MKKALLILAIITSGALLQPGCGGKYEVEVDPIKVEVIHRISTSELLTVFKAQCRRELGPSATPSEVQNCAEAKLADFLDDLGEALGEAN